jgi:heme oxygenase (mycobilin-producing)
MNAYFAYGTKEYLQQIHEKNLGNSMNTILLASNNDALLIHETEGPNSFNEEHTYEIMESMNEPRYNDFVVLKYILTTEEASSLVESKIKNILNHVTNQANGLQAARIYKPIHADKYIFLTAWKSQNDFMLWNNSDTAKEFNNFINEEEAVPQSLLEGGAFSKTYFVVNR